MLGWSHITHIILTCQIQRSTDGANLFQVKQLWDVAYTWWHSGIPNPFQTNVYKRVLKKLAIQATNKGYNTNTCQKAKWQKEYFLLITVTSLANRSMFKYFFLILGYRDIFKNGFYQRKKLCQITQYTSIIVILDLIYIYTSTTTAQVCHWHLCCNTRQESQSLRWTNASPKAPWANSDSSAIGLLSEKLLSRSLEWEQTANLDLLWCFDIFPIQGWTWQ